MRHHESDLMTRRPNNWFARACCTLTVVFALAQQFEREQPPAKEARPEAYLAASKVDFRTVLAPPPPAASRGPSLCSRESRDSPLRGSREGARTLKLPARVRRLLPNSRGSGTPESSGARWARPAFSTPGAVDVEATGGLDS